jgi:ankyrin repeat protein
MPQNERGITPLGVAVGFNQQAMVALLLSKGADAARQDPAGNTLLHYAAGYGRKAIAQQLLDAGLDPKVANKAGMTACDAARTNKEVRCGRYLLHGRRTPMGCACGQSVRMLCQHTHQ